MSFIRTVLGDILPDQFGFCYAHEHVIIDPSFTTHTEPDFLHDSVDQAVAELQQFYEEGGRAMVDASACDNGRNVLKLAEISRRSGVHIVCATGLHLEKYYDPGHWSQHYTREDLADLFCAEIQEGVDANDCNGPIVHRTPHKAGVIKVASGLGQLSPHEKKVFRAAADVHRATGCPILTHTEKGTAALEQIALFHEEGAQMANVVISHTDRKPDLDYHRKILGAGVNVEFDSAFRWRRGNPTFDLVLALFREFPNQILLGMDAARHRYWKSYGGQPGMSYLIKVFVPALRKCGMSAQDVERIFVRNPARAFAFPTLNVVSKSPHVSEAPPPPSEAEGSLTFHYS